MPNWHCRRPQPRPHLSCILFPTFYCHHQKWGLLRLHQVVQQRTGKRKARQRSLQKCFRQSETCFLHSAALLSLKWQSSGTRTTLWPSNHWLPAPEGETEWLEWRTELLPMHEAKAFPSHPLACVQQQQLSMVPRLCSVHISRGDPALPFASWPGLWMARRREGQKVRWKIVDRLGWGLRLQLEPLSRLICRAWRWWMCRAGRSRCRLSGEQPGSIIDSLEHTKPWFYYTANWFKALKRNLMQQTISCCGKIIFHLVNM